MNSEIEEEEQIDFFLLILKDLQQASFNFLKALAGISLEQWIIKETQM